MKNFINIFIVLLLFSQTQSKGSDFDALCNQTRLMFCDIDNIYIETEELIKGLSGYEMTKKVNFKFWGQGGNFLYQYVQNDIQKKQF
jgi:hypothetical protein